ncbi:hypothetical protein HDU97_005474, partial [Phlyctochytrium planicorne]
MGLELEDQEEFPPPPPPVAASVAPGSVVQGFGDGHREKRQLDGMALKAVSTAAAALSASGGNAADGYYYPGPPLHSNLNAGVNAGNSFGSTTTTVTAGTGYATTREVLQPVTFVPNQRGVGDEEELYELQGMGLSTTFGKQRHLGSGASVGSGRRDGSLDLPSAGVSISSFPAATAAATAATAAATGGGYQPPQVYRPRQGSIPAQGAAYFRNGSIDSTNAASAASAVGVVVPSSYVQQQQQQQQQHQHQHQQRNRNPSIDSTSNGSTFANSTGGGGAGVNRSGSLHSEHSTTLLLAQQHQQQQQQLPVVPGGGAGGSSQFMEKMRMRGGGGVSVVTSREEVGGEGGERGDGSAVVVVGGVKGWSRPEEKRGAFVERLKEKMSPVSPGQGQ